MKYLPITLIVVLSSSLFVALIINPVLTSVFMRVGEEAVNKRRSNRVSLSLAGFGVVFLVLGATAFGNVLIIAGLMTALNAYVLSPATRVFQDRFLPRLERGYERFLRFALAKRRPWFFFFGTASLMVVAFALLGAFPPKVEFFPSNEPQYLNIFITKPIGTDIEETNRVTREIEGMVLEVLNEDRFKRLNPETGELESYMANSVIGQVGNGTSDPQEGPSLGNTPHKARIVVNFVKFQERQGQSTRDMLRAVRERLSGYAEAEIVVTKNSDGPPQGRRSTSKSAVKITTMFWPQPLHASVPRPGFRGVEELKIDVDKRSRTPDHHRPREGSPLRTVHPEHRIHHPYRSFGREVSSYRTARTITPSMCVLRSRLETTSTP